MSNMLYACSILYKTKLPFLIAFNKIDVVSCDFANEWMRDFESFEAKLETHTSFLANFTRSLSLVLDKFYENISTVGVSGGTGQGMSDLISKIDAAGIEYLTQYKPHLERIHKLAKEKREQKSEQTSESDNQFDADNESDDNNGLHRSEYPDFYFSEKQFPDS
jgi:hypothetical protein